MVYHHTRVCNKRRPLCIWFFFVQDSIHKEMILIKIDTIYFYIFSSTTDYWTHGKGSSFVCCIRSLKKFWLFWYRRLMYWIIENIVITLKDQILLKHCDIKQASHVWCWNKLVMKRHDKAYKEILKKACYEKTLIKLVMKRLKKKACYEETLIKLVIWRDIHEKLVMKRHSWKACYEETLKKGCFDASEFGTTRVVCYEFYNIMGIHYV